MRRVFLSPSLLVLAPIAFALVVFFAILLPHQPLMWIVAVVAAYMSWRILRRSILVVDRGRVWVEGRKHPVADIARVRVARMPLTPGASVVLLETRAGAVLNAGLWRLGQSSTVRLGNEVADAVEAARRGQ